MKLVRTVTAILLVAGLSACAIPDNARSGLRPLDEKNGVLAFSDGPFKRAASERIMFADPSQREEYALFKSPRGVAEVVYITTRHLHLKNIHLESAMTSDKMLRSWTYTKNAKPTEVDAYWFDAGWIGMWVRPFTISETQQSCAAFNAEWDVPADDTEQFPSKTIFGYFCNPAGTNMTAGDVEKRLTEVGVRGINIKLGADDEIVEVPAIPKIPSQTDLMSRVQQGPYGIPEFPYIMARIYNLNLNCGDDIDC